MCWVAAIPAALAVVGGIRSGNTQSANLNAQATTATANAAFSNRAADDAVRRGTYDADIQRLRTGQEIGTQRAAQAANGGMVNQDTNALLQDDTAQLGELDALTIQNNAAREAYGYKVQALNSTTQAAQLKAQASTTKRNSLLGGIISGAGSLFGSGAFGGSASGTTAALRGNSGASLGTLSNQAYA